MQKAGDKRLSEFDTLDMLFNDFNDPYYREDLDIKKPSNKAMWAAVDKLLAEGKTIADIDEDNFLLADALIEINPNLRRE